jgi:hypothetical protein
MAPFSINGSLRSWSGCREPSRLNPRARRRDLLAERLLMSQQARLKNTHYYSALMMW